MNESIEHCAKMHEIGKPHLAMMPGIGWVVGLFEPLPNDTEYNGWNFTITGGPCASAREAYFEGVDPTPLP